MVGWHHRLNGHEFEQTQGDGEKQGSPEFLGLQKVEHDLETEQQNKQQAVYLRIFFTLSLDPRAKIDYQSCLTLYNPVNCSTLGFPVLR